MKKFSISKAVTFTEGTVLGLTPEQAAPRAHALRELEEGVFVVEQPVQFKIGEVIGHEGDLPKAIAQHLEDDKPADSKPAENKGKTPAPAKPKAATKPKASAKKASGSAAKPEAAVPAADSKPAETPAAS
jgi:hypothetical protein